MNQPYEVQILGGPQDGEVIVMEAIVPVPFTEKLSFNIPLDEQDELGGYTGDHWPTRQIMVTPTYEKLPCGSQHWVLRWPRLEREGVPV